VFPAIYGTVVMVLIMSVTVTPLGGLAAFCLREYARQGAFVSAVRIVVNNLAGVPSIVFGVFGVGFFTLLLLMIVVLLNLFAITLRNRLPQVRDGGGLGECRWLEPFRCS
jgi:ABC-type phosphate transport system permease subunit